MKARLSQSSANSLIAALAWSALGCAAVIVAMTVTI